jgi:hypothetical protein
MNQEYLNVQLNKLVNNLEKSLEQIDFIEELNELEGGGIAVNTVPRAVNIRPPAAAQTTTRNVTPVVAQTTRNVTPVDVFRTPTRNVTPVVAQTTTNVQTEVASTGAPAVDYMAGIQESLNLIKQGAQTSISAKEIDQTKFTDVINEVGKLKEGLNEILKEALKIQTGVDIGEHNDSVDSAHEKIDAVKSELDALSQLFDQQGGSNELVNLEYNL